MRKWITSAFIFLVGTQSNCCLADNYFRLSVNYLPYLGVDADIDPAELNGGILFNHNLDHGDGLGVKFSLVDVHYSDTDVLSLAYYRGSQSEVGNGNTVRSHALYVEAGKELHYQRTDTLVPYAAFLLGFGGVNFDFRANKSKEWAGAAEFSVDVGVKMVNHVRASIGATAFLWGYPGETIGNGLMLSSQIGVEF